MQPVVYIFEQEVIGTQFYVSKSKSRLMPEIVRGIVAYTINLMTVGSIVLIEQ
jgi:hypothetical protein